MWSAVVFGASFVGLVVLFLLKSLEVARGKHTPLSLLRRTGDPMVRRFCASCRSSLANLTTHGSRLFSAGFAAGFERLEKFFLGAVHAVTARLNRYLRTKRVRARGNGAVSPHLRNVLNYKEAQIDADASADKPQ